MSSALQLARPAIRELVPYSAASYADGLVRLNANETPWPAPGCDGDLNRYPPERPEELTARRSGYCALTKARPSLTASLPVASVMYTSWRNLVWLAMILKSEPTTSSIRSVPLRTARKPSFGINWLAKRPNTSNTLESQRQPTLKASQMLTTLLTLLRHFSLSM